MKRKLYSLDRPLPRRAIAWYLSWRWSATVSPEATIRYPFRLSLGAGTTLGRCTIICTAPVTLGRAVAVRDYAIIDAQGGPVAIGEQTGINPFCVLYGAGGLHIGSHVLVAAHTVLIPSNHRFDRLDVPITLQGTDERGITIGDDVWLGTRVTVLDGVKVGAGAVVAAGAVVTHDVPPGAVVAGVPARVLRQRGDQRAR